MSDTTKRPRKIRLGIVGGGAGSNIGEAHRYAARLDDRYRLVTGVFASTAERSREFAAGLGIASDRQYASWQEMAEKESQRPDGLEVVSILTPNNSHHAIAKGFLQHGIHVICDKPLTTELSDALELVRLTRETERMFGVTYNYTGYPMVRQAKAMIQAGELGEIRLVQVEHASGWASTLLEAQGHKQAVWRTTPAIAGKSSVVGDLGTHAHHLARFVSGLEITQLSAELSTMVPGRQSDDNAHIKLRFSNGARGLLWASMVATGNLHGQRIRVYGEKGSLEWVQENPNDLWVRWGTGRQETYSRGFDWLALEAQQSSRLWPGHPEGFLEAFANLYGEIADAIIAHGDGGRPFSYPFPTVWDGALGVRFVDAAVESHSKDGAWVNATLEPEKERFQ
ncbi:MAG: Gfo/Idh/MocA family oxidoreductase [Thermaceae bacterium]|nr:Gfo/Idh/MocA family oxidoreductase [Thermaceae bacterium]